MNVVIPVRKGGLGNQMFQVAAGLIYAKETNRSLVLPDETPHEHRVHTEPYEKSIFQNMNKIEGILDSSSLYSLCQNGFTLYPGEPGFEKWSILPIEENILLHGYFQYYPPIEKHKDFIAQTYLQNLESCRIEGNKTHIGIHVRRGDYLKFPDVFPILDHSYYCRAIYEMEKRVPGEKVYMIFSNDIAWCKEQEMFQALENVLFIEEQDEIKALCTMIACEGGFICANSSYSWWGAFLGAFQQNAPCIVPEQWMKGATGDLIPKEWIIIPEAKGKLVFYPSGNLNLHEQTELENIIKPLKNTVEVYVETELYSNADNFKIFIQSEPTAISDQLAVKNIQEFLFQNNSIYDIVYSYNQQILNTCPNAVKSILPACSWISGKHHHTIDSSKKQFQISCITGSKQMTEGHEYRLLLYYNQSVLKNNYSLPITFFRSSAGSPLPEVIQNENPFLQKDKFPLFETYQYSLVIENSSQQNYFTEKLIDCLITKTIPIYYGCPNIAEYFDTTGWILLTEEKMEDRVMELLSKWNQVHYTNDSYSTFSNVIEANYKTCKQKYSGFYTKINRLFLELPAFAFQ